MFHYCEVKATVKICKCKNCGNPPVVSTYVSLKYGKQTYYACYKTRECRLDGNNMVKRMNELLSNGGTFDASVEWTTINQKNRKRKG